MIKTDKAGITTDAGQKSISSRISDARSELRPQLKDAWSGAMQAAEAQTAIWGMKAGRAAVMGVFGLAALGILTALMVCGFVLLDDAIDYALTRPDMPWLSPVVRGGVYFLIPLIAFVTVWHMAVGWGSAENEETHSPRQI
jgi:hypothetical protein